MVVLPSAYSEEKGLLSFWAFCSQFLNLQQKGSHKKTKILGQVRLTVSVDLPPPGQFFVIFSGILLTWCYDYMCSETDFTQEKVNFHATSGIPNSSSYCCCPPDDHLQEAGPSFWQPRKGHEKCIFETLQNEIKCVLSVKESNFNKKNKIVLFAYGQGRGCWPHTPPPPPPPLRSAWP